VLEIGMKLREMVDIEKRIADPEEKLEEAEKSRP